MKRFRRTTGFLCAALMISSLGTLPVYAEETQEPLPDEYETEEVFEGETDTTEDGTITEEEDVIPEETAEPADETAPEQDIPGEIQEDGEPQEPGDGNETPEEPGDDTPEEPGDDTPTEEDGIEAFVVRLYQLVLLREPDENGLAYWKNGITNGSITGCKAVKGFFLSNEMNARGLSSEEYVQTLYRAIFNREADAGGLANWVNRLDIHMTRESVINGFLNSQEFINLCEKYGVTKGTTGSTGAYRDQNYNVTAFVNRMYTYVLNRAADVGGVENWCQKILKKNQSGADLVVGFFFSPEFIKKKVSNEAFIKAAYRTLFNREGDSAGMKGWLTKLSKKYSRKEVLAGFIASTEFTNLCRKYGIRRGSLLVGWINYNGKRCYVKSNGNRATTEVLTISGKLYGFNAEGYWIGSKTARYLAVYKKGIKLFKEVTNTSMTKVQKLRACFEILRTFDESNPWIPHDNSYGWVERYATHLFDNRWGNCMCMAASFGIMAQIAGYDNVYCCNSRHHGWVEIDGLVYDPERSIYLPGNFFGRSIDSGGGIIPDYRNDISRVAPSSAYYKI